MCLLIEIVYQVNDVVHGPFVLLDPISTEQH